MDNLAKAREVVIACGWTKSGWVTEDNPEVPFDEEDVRRIAAAIDEARLEELKLVDDNYWGHKTNDFRDWMQERLHKHAAALRERGKV